MSDSNASHEPHPWADKTPDEVLHALVYELYPPVSALGDEMDRLSTGAFEDEELTTLLAQMPRASIISAGWWCCSNATLPSAARRRMDQWSDAWRSTMRHLLRQRLRLIGRSPVTVSLL